MRIKILRLVISVLFIVLVSGLFTMQVIRGKYFFDLSRHNRIRVVALDAWRGRIEDRNGIILADNRLTYNVVVIPQEVKEVNELFGFLSGILQIDQENLVAAYQEKKYKPFIPVVIAEDIKREEAMIIEENKFKFPGLLVQESYKRFYPFRENSAHVLGYVGAINRAKLKKFREYGFTPQSLIGYSGVEEYYDAFLKGEAGGLQVEVNSRGQQVRLLSFKEPKSGGGIALTIDKNLQTRMMELINDRPGVILVMDMDNGEILGLTNSPSFNPNIFLDQKYNRRLKVLSRNSLSPFLNRAIHGLYPPGSVFKVPVALCALDSHKTNAKTSFNCRGFLELGGIKFRCSHVHGLQNLVESITHSCNVYYFNLAKILGPKPIGRYAKMLGLGALTHVDLPYEKPGNIPHPRSRIFKKRARWYQGDTLNLAIGQGDVLTTPIQLVRMMATIANNGWEVQPHVIKSIGGQAINKYSFRRKIQIDDQVIKTIKKGLRASVIDYSGTAHALDIKGMYIAGKTGTAQSSPKKDDHSWFVGYVRGHTRNIAICVFLEHGGSSQNAVLLTRHLVLEMKEMEVL